MDRLRRGAREHCSLARVSCFDAGRRFGAVGLVPLGGAVLALAVLVGLTLAGAPAHAAFPGPNGKIACGGPMDRTSPDPFNDDDLEVYTIDPDGSNRVFLTDNPVRGPEDPDTFYNDDNDPTFSPDGTKIAFTSLRNGDDDTYTMNADGSGVTQVTAVPGVDVPIGWSADNSKIYLETTRTGNYEVFSVGADGSTPTNLSNLPGATDVGPKGSPDGTKILFWSNRDGNFEIYSMDANGSNVVRLTTNTVTDYNPDWSPDGTQIVFERAVAGFPNQIFKMNANGTDVTQLTSNPGTNATGRNTQPIWSPDGERILFNSLRDRPVGAGSSLNNYYEAYTMSAADGSDVQRVTDSYGEDLGCDWQAIPRVAPPVTTTPPAGPPVTTTPPTPTPDDGDDGDAGGDRVRPNLIRPGFARAVQRGTRAGSAVARVSQSRRGGKVLVRLRGKMLGNRGRPCGGRIKIGTRAGRRRVATTTGRMARNCRYSKKYTVAARRLPKRLRPRNRTLVLRIAVRFQGNSQLRGDLSPTKRVKVRR